MAIRFACDGRKICSNIKTSQNIMTKIVESFMLCKKSEYNSLSLEGYNRFDFQLRI